MSRCVACDAKMSVADFVMDDDMCGKCLLTIVDEMQEEDDLNLEDEDE